MRPRAPTSEVTEMDTPHVRRETSLRRRIGWSVAAAVVAVSGGLSAIAPAAVADPAVAVAPPQPGSPEVVTITRVDGVDARGSFSVTTRTVDGVPVVDTHGLTPRAVAAGVSASARREAATSGLARLAGASRYETAVAVSRRAFETGAARSVYLARGDRLGDALAGGSLTDGPVLLVPPTGAVPQLVLDEIRRLGPAQVVGIGRSLPQTVLTAAAQGRATSRLAGADDYATAAAVARRAFPTGATEVYLSLAGASPDAVAGGALTRGPVLQVPATGAVPASVSQAIAALKPTRVLALGGAGAISDRTLASAAAGRRSGRLAGADRYATAAAIASSAFPRGAKVAYLAGGASFADAAVGGALTDGPILLVPPATAGAALRKATSGALVRLGATAVGVLGGPGAVSESALVPILAGAPAVVPGSLPPVAGAVSEPTPTPTPSAQSPAPAPPSGVTKSCDSLIGTFRPISLDHRYTASCVDSLSADGSVLGLTTTYLFRADESLSEGTVEIARNPDGALLEQVIAHELGHAYSYSDVTPRQRAWFVRELAKVNPDVVVAEGFNGSGYLAMPAEQWARGMATRVGYPDRFRRPTASCALIEGATKYTG